MEIIPGYGQNNSDLSFTFDVENFNVSANLIDFNLGTFKPGFSYIKGGYYPTGIYEI